MQIYKKEYFAPRGYPATIMGVIPYAGVSFFTYDVLKRWYAGKWNRCTALHYLFQHLG